jgi:hypothetical protein
MIVNFIQKCTNKENVMFIKKLTLLAMIPLMLAGCQSGPSAQEQAATMVAQTAAAATNTPIPAPTSTPTQVPPTSTITPTSAPTFTSTPTGPLVIKDDFSKKSDIWGKCDKCEWRDGKLFFGPFDPNGNGTYQIFAVVCKACGTHAYFHMAADIAFASGIAGDRAYGVGITVPDEFYAGTGIAPSQYGALAAADYSTNKWVGSKYLHLGVIKPGAATNRVEFNAKPNASGGVDYYAIVNGNTITVLSNITARASTTLKPSIYLGWHSVGISVDNFEYEEIAP